MSEALLNESLLRLSANQKGTVETVLPELVIRLEGSGQRLTIPYGRIESGIVLIGGVPYYAGSGRKVQPQDRILLQRIGPQGTVRYAVELDLDRTVQDSILHAVSRELGSAIEPIRVPEDDLTMQIGCVRLLVPTTFVRVERVASTQYFPVLRSRGSIKKNSGQVDTRITLQIIYPDEESINDPENGLRALIAMFRRTPFVPIYNRHLNLNEDIWAVCLHDLQVSTIAGFPRSLMVELVLLEFDWSVYLLDYSDFGSAINWTLFNWYVRRGLLDENGTLKPARFGGKDVAFEYVPSDKLEQAAANVQELSSGRLRGSVTALETRYRKAKEDVDRVREALEAVERIKTLAPEELYTMRVLFGSPRYEDFQTLFDEHKRTSGEDGITLDLRTLKLTAASERLYQRMLRHLDDLRRQMVLTQQRYQTALSANVELLTDTEPWPIEGDLVVTAVQAGAQNYFARLPVQSRTKPVYQYLGSTDHRIQLGMIADEQALRSLQELFRYCQESARKYYSKFSSGFLRIQNPITDLFGIQWVLIEAMVSQSIPGYPGHYQVELTLIDYDQFQTARMRGVFLTKSQDQYIIKVQEGQELPGTVVFGLENQEEWIKAEKVFPLIDCYPDLDLPTWDEVADFLSKQTGRTISPEEINTNGGHFVDPDFYFLPPAASDREIAYGAASEEAVAVSIEDKDQSLDRQRLRDEVLRIVANPGVLSGASRVRSGDANLGDSFINPQVEEKVEYAGAEAEEDDVVDAPKPSGRSGLFERAFHDYLKYNYRGRMIRAFPTFHMFVIDEGGWVRHRRLWDNFYGFNAISSIEIHHSRLLATGTCLIELANADHFIRPDRETYYRPGAKVFRIDWNNLLPLSITYDMIKRRQSLPEKIFLKPGARIHLRLGYGNNLAELPIVFNGTVTDVQYGEVVTMVAQTDARELVEPIFFSEDQVASSIFGGHYPRAFLLRLLLYGSAGWLGRQVQKIRYGIWSEPINGVIHFGNPEQKLFSRKAGELGQNIYYGKEKNSSAAESPWALFTGEFRVPLMLYNKSIWDIGEVLAAAVPNFVFAVRPFEMRSTIFYGKPWWDLAYGYEVLPDPTITPERAAKIRRDLAQIPVAEEAVRRAVAYAPRIAPGGLTPEALERMHQNALRSLDVTSSEEDFRLYRNMTEAGWRPGRGYWVRELKKTFSQWHIYTSADAIIRNDIRLSMEGVYNNVTGLYLEHGNKQQSILVRADPDIYPQFQRGKVVHTELHAEGGWFPLLGSLQAYIYGSFARTVAMNIAASVLRDSMKDMYQGELVVIGDPTVWPYDTMYLADLHRDMTGTCFVKEVYHHFSLDTGFVTVISPDLACAVKDSEAYDWLGLSLYGTALSFFGLFRASFAEFFKRILVKTNEGMIRRLMGLESTQRILRSGAAALRNAGQMAQRIWSALRGMRGMQYVGRAGLWATRVIAAAGGAAVSLPYLGAALIATPVAILGYTMLREGLRRQGMADRMLVCNFLTYKGGEFSVGVDGSTQLTVVIPELATEPTFRDLVLDVLPGFASYREPSATELFGELGGLASDEALRALLTEEGELGERLKGLSDVELVLYGRGKRSDSTVLLSALYYLGVPYRRGGKDTTGIDIRGFVEAVLDRARIPRPSSDRLSELFDESWFVEVARGAEILEELKPGDVILFDRNPNDGVDEYDQAVIVVDPDGWGVAVIERDLERHSIRAGVRIVNYNELYRDVPRKVLRYLGGSP